MQQRRMPRGIDDPGEMLIWSMDEFIIICTCLVIGVVIGAPVVLTIIGLIVGRFLRRHKDSTPDGHLNHIVYWIGLRGEKGRGFCNPYKRRWTR